MDWADEDRGDRFGRLVGAMLIAEACLLVVERLFTLVYIVASQVYLSDKHRTPGARFLPFLLVTIVIVTVLSWAGKQLRRTPDGAWRAAGAAGRVVLALAGAFNLAIVAWLCVKVITSDTHEPEALVAGSVVGLMALMIVIGIVRDAVATRHVTTAGR